MPTLVTHLSTDNAASAVCGARNSEEVRLHLLPVEIREFWIGEFECSWCRVYDRGRRETLLGGGGYYSGPWSGAYLAGRASVVDPAMEEG